MLAGPQALNHTDCQASSVISALSSCIYSVRHGCVELNSTLLVHMRFLSNTCAMPGCGDYPMNIAEDMVRTALHGFSNHDPHVKDFLEAVSNQHWRKVKAGSARTSHHKTGTSHQSLAARSAAFITSDQLTQAMESIRPIYIPHLFAQHSTHHAMRLAWLFAHADAMLKTHGVLVYYDTLVAAARTSVPMSEFAAAWTQFMHSPLGRGLPRALRAALKRQLQLGIHTESVNALLKAQVVVLMS